MPIFFQPQSHKIFQGRPIQPLHTLLHTVQQRLAQMVIDTNHPLQLLQLPGTLFPIKNSDRLGKQ